jgi:hypothetical protein
MTRAELDRKIDALTEQRDSLRALRGHWMVDSETEEAREILHLINHGIRRGAGVPPALTSVDIGPGLRAIESELQELLELRQFLHEHTVAVEPPPALDHLAIAALHAECHREWLNLLTIVESCDAFAARVVAARAALPPHARVILPEAEYIGLIGAELRLLAATGGTIDDPTLANELRRARARRVVTETVEV